MKKIGLFYGTTTAKTTLVALKIREAFGEEQVDIIPVENAEKKDFESYQNIIAGTSTWFDGELPTYWDEIIPELQTIDLSGKNVAIFGLGDQVNYPDNFVDGIGILAKVFENCHARIVGRTSTADYQFNQSRAVNNQEFLGLAIDIENQPDQTEERIIQWVNELKKEFD